MKQSCKKKLAPAGRGGGHFKTLTMKEGYSGAKSPKNKLGYFCLRETGEIFGHSHSSVGAELEGISHDRVLLYRGTIRSGSCFSY